MNPKYQSVTELAGDDVTQEQVERMYHRYIWASEFCKGKNVIEVACGSGIGLGFLSNISRNLKAGDISNEILEIPRKYYGDRIEIKTFDAQDMPFPDYSIDIVILFEAIYYLPSVKKFVSECKRILRNNGKVLIATANKDLFDFNPSPYTYKYYGVVELNELFKKYGFNIEFFGYCAVDKVSIRQKITRPIKAIAAKLNIIPKTTSGKKLLKRFIFGSLVKMPSEIKEGDFEYYPPMQIYSNIPDTRYKVIYCVATKQ